jgi:hypothetical protein
MDLANNLLPSFMEIAIAGLVVMAARKWNLREALVTAMIGIGGLGVCLGVIQLSGSEHAVQTVVQLGIVTIGLAAWARIFHVTWRDSRRAAIAEAAPIAVTGAPDNSGSAPGHAAEAKQPAPVAVDPYPIVHAPCCARPLRGIGIVNQVSIRLIERTPLRFWCECTVIPIGLGGDAIASPSELLLMVPGTILELATLKVNSRRATGSRQVVYSGFASGEAIEKQFEMTMGRHFESASNLAQIPQPTFCEVEIRLPNGHALAEHGKSGVLLDFELTVQSSVHIVRIPRPQV